jgi:hypothetical protein
VEPVKIVDYILPVLLPKLPRVVVQNSGGGVSGTLAEHDLGGPLHFGVLRDEQAPQFLKSDGSRLLAGDLPVGSGVKIDGVDISAHASDPDAHHTRVTVQGPLTITDQLVGLAWGNGLHVPSLTTLEVRLEGAGGLVFGAQGGVKLATPGTVGVGTNNAVGAASHTHAVDFTTTAQANKLLALDANGSTAANTLTAHTKVRTPLLDTASGDVTIQPAAELMLNPGGGIVRVKNGAGLQSESFTNTSFSGSGWRIDYDGTEANAATAAFDDVVVRRLLRVYELVISKIRTGNGSYLFADGGKVVAVSGSGPYTLTFDEDHGLAVSDLLRAQKFLGGAYVSNCTVTGVPTAKTAVVTLQSGSAPQAGYEYVRIGNTTDANRQGSVYITSNDSGAPFIDIINGVNSHAAWGTAAKNKGRFGKLSGITGRANEYGLFVGSGVTPTDTYLRLSDYTGGNGINNLPFKLTDNGLKTVELAPGKGINVYSSYGTPAEPGTRINFYNSEAGTFLSAYISAWHNSNVFLIEATKDLRLQSGPTRWQLSDSGNLSGYARFFSLTAGNGAFPTETTNTLTLNWYDPPRINGFDIHHAGNFQSGVDYAPAVHTHPQYAPLAGASFTGAVSAKSLTVNGTGSNDAVWINARAGAGGNWGIYNPDGALGFYHSSGGVQMTLYSNGVVNFLAGTFSTDSASGFSFLKTAGTAQIIRTGGVLASSSYSHQARVPAHGIYSLGPVAVATADGAGAGYNLDVSGAVRFRASANVGTYLELTAASAPAGAAGALRIWWDNANWLLKATLPNGTTKTITLS